MSIVDFSRVKDHQLAAYLQAVEGAIGRQAISASVADLAELPPEELAERLAEARAELQSRTLIPEPVIPPSDVDGWKFAAGYPKPSATARGLWDVRIVKGKATQDFYSLSSVDEAQTLRWAAKEAAALAADRAQAERGG